MLITDTNQNAFMNHLTSIVGILVAFFGATWFLYKFKINELEQKTIRLEIEDEARERKEQEYIEKVAVSVSEKVAKTYIDGFKQSVFPEMQLNIQETKKMIQDLSIKIDQGLKYAHERIDKLNDK
jgi:hypothetical protein